ncbi:TIGR03089 family protein [Blastococcus sp. LR1]|uniref:TIGR03089 family protein n=1 Tax=Blastococcus sp. LR1 TaxID=2877000 RepID=UPI001CCE7E45|nr:TIGR03089 family protein [Blastococcus sp. LR1]MCA0146220.1 TIGR03089 family protein [Blastococcus sp. LR1]
MTTTGPTASPTSGAALPADLLAAALRRDPAAPLVTFYDDATDERVELSAATLANWVAKTANLLQDEFDVGPGSTVALALPVHWQTAAVLLAVWSCGAAVLDTATEDEERLADVDVVLAARDRLDALEEAQAAAGTGELLGLSLHPLGLGMAGYTGEARDFALEVRVHGDFFTPYDPPRPTEPGLLVGGLALELGGLVPAATELAGRLGIVAGDRVLVEERTAEEAGPVAWLLAPLAAGASLVLHRHAAEDRVARRAEAERVTATLGRRIEGIRELGRPA